MEKPASTRILFKDMECAESQGPLPPVHGAPHRLGERHSTVLWWQEHNIRVKRHHRESVERPQGVLYVDPPHPQRLCEGPRLC